MDTNLNIKLLIQISLSTPQFTVFKNSLQILISKCCFNIISDDLFSDTLIQRQPVGISFKKRNGFCSHLICKLYNLRLMSIRSTPEANNFPIILQNPVIVECHTCFRDMYLFLESYSSVQRVRTQMWKLRWRKIYCFWGSWDVIWYV